MRHLSLMAAPKSAGKSVDVHPFRRCITLSDNRATSTTIGRGRHAVTPDTTGRNAGERLGRDRVGIIGDMGWR